MVLITIVGRLEERGIVEPTHTTADRRIVLVGLTDEGRRLIGEMEAVRSPPHDFFRFHHLGG